MVAVAAHPATSDGVGCHPCPSEGVPEGSPHANFCKGRAAGGRDAAVCVSLNACISTRAWAATCPVPPSSRPTTLPYQFPSFPSLSLSLFPPPCGEGSLSVCLLLANQTAAQELSTLLHTCERGTNQPISSFISATACLHSRLRRRPRRLACICGPPPAFLLLPYFRHVIGTCIEVQLREGRAYMAVRDRKRRARGSNAARQHVGQAASPRSIGSGT